MTEFDFIFLAIGAGAVVGAVVGAFWGAIDAFRKGGVK